MTLHRKNLIVIYAFILTISMLSIPGPANSQTVWVDPEAGTHLKATMDYLGRLDKFSVHTLNTFEEILEPGQKVQLDFAATLTVQRPEKMRVERHGEVVDQILYYDGKTLTLYDTVSNYYAQAAAPGNIEEMLNFARLLLGLQAPASDLLYRDVFPLMMQDVYSARELGEVSIGGARCTHLAFSRPDVDFQIWVAKSGNPLPCKYVVTDKNSFGQPSVSVVMSDWNLSPETTDEMFSFEAPEGSASTDFMLLDANGNYVQ